MIWLVNLMLVTLHVIYLQKKEKINSLAWKKGSLNYN